MLIDTKIKELVAQIESAHEVSGLEQTIRELILLLKAATMRPLIVQKYQSLRATEGGLGKYPLDADGYAKSFDPLTQEDEFVETFFRYGIVVGKNVITPELRAMAVERVKELMSQLQDAKDATGAPVLSRGFFEIYHDDMLAQLRQSVRLYLHHVLIWGRADLWTSFDRLGVKLPSHPESYALKLHVDQNPVIFRGLKTVQGVLALADCPAERGTYVGVPGSKHRFSEYERLGQGQGEHVELKDDDPMAPDMKEHAQALPIRAGDIVSWDSRTTHANTENVSKDTRFVAYISAGPAKEKDEELVRVRQEAFRTGLGSNVRDALMHASKPPRYTDPDAISRVRKQEQLTLLGELLYGQEKYEKI